MKKSEFLTLQQKDFIKGLIMSVLTSIVTGLYMIIKNGGLPTMNDYRNIGLAAASVFLSYILKNFLTNSQDQFIKSEPKTDATTP